MPLAWFVGYGLVFVGAILGLIVFLRDDAPGDASDLNLGHLALWLVIVLGLLYVPVNFQVRFAEGWHLPIVIFAALGWSRWCVPRLRRVMNANMVRRVGTSIFFLMTPTIMLLLANGIWKAQSESFDLYITPDEQGALDWLNQNADMDAVLLGHYFNGNRVPAYAPPRVFLGHWDQTADYDARTDDVEDFFDAGFPDAARIEMLTTFGVDYVYWGAEERAFGDFDPRAAEYLRPVYESATVRLFVVTVTN